jgi:putative ABC transport system permease protein
MRVVARSFAQQPAQSALATLAVAFGVFTLGVLLQAQFLIATSMHTAYAASQPPRLLIRTEQPFDQAVVAQIEQLPHVVAAEGRAVASLRVTYGNEAWRTLWLTARTDYLRQRLDLVAPYAGEWPPQSGLLFEASALDVTAARIGEQVTVVNTRGERVAVPVTGTVSSLTGVASAFGDGSLDAFVAPATFAQLTEIAGPNELLVAVTPGLPEADLDAIRTAAATALDARGSAIVRMRYRDVTHHPLWQIVAPVLETLTALSTLALLVSALLTASVLRTIMAREIAQIGVLKALGFSAPQVAALYLGGVLLLGTCALLLALPAAMAVAWVLAGRVAGQLNVSVSGGMLAPHVLAAELAVALLLPLAAALLPIRRASQVPVATLLSGITAQTAFGSFWPDRLGRMFGWPARLVYPLRNLLRQKLRLALTLAVLTGCGGVSSAVLNLWLGVERAIQQAHAYWPEDLSLHLPEPLGVALVRQELRSIAGVAAVEERLIAPALWSHSRSPEQQHGIVAVGVPAPSILRPTLLAGRWPEPTEADALVVNAHVLRAVPELAVGDRITLDINDQRQSWRVVGIASSQVVHAGSLFAPVAYLPYPALSEWLDQGGKANQFVIVTDNHAPASVALVARQLGDHLHSYGVYTHELLQAGEIRHAVAQVLGVLAGLCAALCLLFVLVSALSLSSLAAVSVFERRGEIGVLQVLGATSGQIAGLLLRESVAVALVAWAGACVLGAALSTALGDLVGRLLLDAPLPMPPFTVGSFAWLGLSLVFALLAPLAPLRAIHRQRHVGASGREPAAGMGKPAGESPRLVWGSRRARARGWYGEAR